MTVIVSSSTIASLINCPRRFILNYHHTERTPSLATEVGTAVHQALQDATETGDRHAAIKALIKRYPYELWLTATNKERASRSLLSCAVAIDTALDMLDLQGMRLAEVNGRKATELDFLLTLTDKDGKPLDIAYSGSIDSVFVDSTGMPIITDYKTTTKDINLAVLQYSHSLQACIYAIVVASALGIEPTDIEYQYIIIKLDNGMGEVHTERARVTPAKLNEVRGYLKVYTTVLQQMLAERNFPPNNSSCTSFGRPCYFANQCDMAHVNEAITSALTTNPAYRYAYLETGKTDYDIRGRLSL